MSEISQPQNLKNSQARIRSKKLATKIDMTPMVDLAFLLLTFFILTTTLNKSTVMDIVMPEKSKETTPVPEKRVLTLIIDEGEKVYWRHGISVPKVEKISLAHDEISKFLASKNSEIENMLVLVKSTTKSKYKNLVDIVDELNLAKIKRYCIVDITSEDETMIQELHNRK